MSRRKRVSPAIKFERPDMAATKIGARRIALFQNGRSIVSALNEPRRSLLLVGDPRNGRGAHDAVEFN
jgi:hypothetical protein